MRERNGVRLDWFPLVSWRCFVHFYFLLKSCGLCPSDIFAPPWPTGEPKEAPCCKAGAQPAESQLRFARWHPQRNELLSSTDLASGSIVQLTWLAQTLRRRRILKLSRVELLKWKTGGELLGLADVMTGKAHQVCKRFFCADDLRVLSMKADNQQLLHEAELVSPFLSEYHCMSLQECRCVINITTAFFGKRLIPFISRASTTSTASCGNFLAQ